MVHKSLSDRDFNRMSEFIHFNWGLKMPDAKRLMLESRLAKRLRDLNLDSFEAYCEYLFSPRGMETEPGIMIDVLTTNETSFFREPTSLEHLMERVLPEWAQSRQNSGARKLRVWSAGCSSGEEPYTLAMLCSEFAAKHPGLNFDYSLLATDISAKVLKQALAAIYKQERVAKIPLEMKNKYLLKSRDASHHQVRIVPELRARVTFRRVNLMDGFRCDKPMDIIFCRNVIIYFDQETQHRLLTRLCDQLRPEGYLFTGHAETLGGMSLPLEPVIPMVYRKVL